MDLDEVNKGLLADCARVNLSTNNSAKVYLVKQLSLALRLVLGRVLDEVRENHRSGDYTLEPHFSMVMDAEAETLLEQVQKAIETIKGNEIGSYQFRRILDELEAIDSRINSFVLMKKPNNDS